MLSEDNLTSVQTQFTDLYHISATSNIKLLVANEDNEY